MDSTEHHSPQQPQRLSALYQYHNAPEVAPAHGLEYDDTIYPSSDKYPVVHTSSQTNTPGGSYDSSSRYVGKHAYDGGNKPPRIIFGMKVRTFLIVAFVMVLVVVGAAVGGAVGGRSVGDAGASVENSHSTSSATSASPSPTQSSATPTFSPPTPTYTPLADCPAANNTLYTPSFGQQQWTKYCDLASPLEISDGNIQILTKGFMYTFSDCIDVCAAFNGGEVCDVVVYQPEAERPTNCWVGSAGQGLGIDVRGLGKDEGMEVAVLVD